jgi:hypothetical protein
MPNGKPGDHPYTDIVVHGRRVYSETADRLIRRIARLASPAERDRLAELLFRDYNEFSNPDVPKLERLLEVMYAGLVTNAKTRGWELDE